MRIIVRTKKVEVILMSFFSDGETVKMETRDCFVDDALFLIFAL